MKINIANVHPWWIRLLLLIIVGLPPLTGWPITRFLNPSDPIHNLALWTGYACFVWLFIMINVGGEQLLKYLSFATVVALMTAFLGVVVRKGLVLLLPSILGLSVSSKEISYKMSHLLIIMLSVIPYALFFVNAFSVSSLLVKLSSFLKSRKNLALHFALSLRVIQHVTEVASNLLTVWEEENPDRILPRFRRDWNETTFGKTTYFVWFKQAVLTWCFALIIHSLEAIPYFVEEMKRIASSKS